MPEKTYGANVYFTSNPDEIDNEITFDADKPIPKRKPVAQVSAPQASTPAPAPQASAPATTPTPAPQAQVAPAVKATDVIEAKPRVLDKKAVYYTNNPDEIDNEITFDASKPLPDVGSESTTVAEPVVEDVAPAYEEPVAEPVYEETVTDKEPIQEDIPAYLAYEQATAEEETVSEEPVYEEAVAPVYEETPTYEEEPVYEEAIEEEPVKKKNTIGNILGIVSIPLSVIGLLIGLACSCSCGVAWGSILSVIFAGIGFVLGLVSVIVSIIKVRRPSIFGIVGLILSVLTIVISIVFLIIAIAANIGLNIYANSQY